MNKTVSRLALVSAATLMIGSPALAGHRWSTYHWLKGSAQLAVPVGDNVSSKWDTYLVTAINGDANGQGWNASTKIEAPIEPGQTNPKNCRAVAGRIEVCSASYGRNGWLGLASIWLSNGHISQGTTKLNDSYFDTASYNKPEWRRMVTCQEIGHDYGLGHVNEVFDDPNTGSCMDYTNNPLGPPTNEYINQHDKDELDTIYNHAELASTNFAVRSVGQAATPQASASASESGNGPADWGRAIGYDGAGRPDMFELNLGGGRKKITHVFWAIGEGPGASQ